MATGGPLRQTSRLASNPRLTPICSDLLQPDSGLLNSVLRLVGIEGPNWLANTSTALPSVILMIVWRGIGFQMVIFLAGLKQIPADLYEAASMDGAGPVRKFFNITWPMLSPVIFFNLLMETIHAFQIFASAYIISNGEGGPAGSTLFYTLYLYLRGFSDFRMGYASALAWLLFLIILALTIVMFRWSAFWVYYEGAPRRG